MIDSSDLELINPDSLTLAFQFAALLSDNLYPTEVAIDPDGEVSFDWYDSNNQVFSVSIGPTGLLSYARIGLNGSEQFDRKSIPAVILDNIPAESLASVD